MESQEQTEGPALNNLAGGIAALLPLVALVGAAGLMLMLVPNPAEALMISAPFGFGIVLVSGVCAVVLGVALFLAAGRAWRIPVAVPAVLCTGPWLLGLGGSLFMMTRADGAIRHAALSDQSRFAAAGVSESMTTTVAGAWLSASLLGAVGLGLAIGAFSRKSAGRTALLGLAVAPLGLAALVLPFLLFREASPLGWVMAPAALAGTLTLGLSASSVGTDDRSGGQAAGACFAALIGALLCALVGRTVAMQTGIGAVAYAAPADRTRILSGGILGASMGMWLVGLAFGLFGLGLAVAGGLALKRTGARTRLLVGAAAAALMVGVVFGADRLVERSQRATLEHVAEHIWDAHEDFRTTEAGGRDLDERAQALVTRTEVIPADGFRTSLQTSEAVSVGDAAALESMFRSLLEDARRVDRVSGPWEPSEPEPPEVEVEDERLPQRIGEGADMRLDDGEEIALALDARLSQASYLAVFRAADAAGARVVSLVGQHALGEDAHIQEFIARDPLLARLSRDDPGCEEVLLPSALPEGYADRDETLWYGSIDPTGTLRLSTRGAHSELVIEDQDPRLEDRLLVASERVPVVYLVANAALTPTRLMLAAGLIRHLGGRTFLVAGPMPGSPESLIRPSALTALPGGALDTVLDGSAQPAIEEDEIGERSVRGRVNAGALEDESGSGVFDPSIVTRQIRARIRAIQRCYERELRTNPELAGRIVVRFTIEERGVVTGAVASENTTGSPAVASCVVNTIRRFRFNPGPEGGSVTFAYPFVFAPDS